MSSQTESPGNLEARLSDQKYFSPPQEFVEQANVKSSDIYDRFSNFPEGFTEYAEMLDWYDPWDEVLDDSNPPFYKWFTGGKLNASHNCVDRHLEDRGDETALLWEGEKEGEVQKITYRDLHRRVNECAAAFRSLGIEEDDVVTFHLPMVPELPVAMLAAARIGAPHSEVFAGFSAQALADRLKDADSQYLVTIDGYYRRGDFLNHKQKTEEALSEPGVDVDSVVVCQRESELHPDVELVEGRDVLFDEVTAEHSGETVEPVQRDAEDTLFLMYTSGTTGKPKGCQHRTGGYLSYVTGTSKYVLDIKPEDTYWCMADIGWITGHSYIVYGPLSLGTTSVMYEGAPDHPHKGYTWELSEKHDVDIFHTSPTAVRMFMKWGEEHPEKYDFDFRHMTTVGEPIQPEAWMWYYKHIGNESAVIVDTWWQTETGGHLITNLPALDDMKPGSAGKPCPGIDPALFDDDGEELPDSSDDAGNLVIKRPWPGMLQTVYGDDERFISEYWEAFSDTDSSDSEDWIYKAGDGAVKTDDGYYRILGRLDDVMNMAGHRIGTMELESAVSETEGVSEPAVAPREHAEKGEVPDVYVVLREGYEETQTMHQRIIESVEDEIGSFARPANVFFVDDLPKTRSGKIMRRLLEDISNENELGNTDTLRNPEIVEEIRQQVQE
ncbi:MAG: acetate--CoA ligase [bacterium]